MSKRYLLLGASRGLGWSTYQQLAHSHGLGAKYMLVSRKIENKQNQFLPNTDYLKADFSTGHLTEEFINQVLFQFDPTDIIYFAGGGPYGLFQSKKWADHLWSFNTTFLFPAELLHKTLVSSEQLKSLSGFTFVGSAIAESAADPQAVSYAASKHALKGLITSIQAEAQSSFKIKLFSPGYMQTDLLPLNSLPRQKKLAEDPVEVAKKLIAFIEKND